MKHKQKLKKSLSKKRRTIYIDMDGVVADFNSYVSNVIGRPIGWDQDDLTVEEWDSLTKIPNFYRHLPLIEESVRMVGLCKSFSSRVNVEFLTAIPRQTTMPTAKQDKIDWIGQHFPVTAVNFGPFSKDKQYWARPGDILIDDKPSNIQEWGAAGGIPVYHFGNFDNTIKLILYAMDEIPEPQLDLDFMDPLTMRVS
jgi:5'(3')-deoxyribonucleotidase